MSNGQNDTIAVDNNSVPAEKDRVAKELARIHLEMDTSLTRVFRLHTKAEAEAGPTEPIKLLEVNEGTFSAGVLPLHFGPVPSRGIPFSTIIIEVTPEEFQKIKAGELHLPDGWQIGEELSGAAAGGD